MAFRTFKLFVLRIIYDLLPCRCGFVSMCIGGDVRKKKKNKIIGTSPKFMKKFENVRNGEDFFSPNTSDYGKCEMIYDCC